MRVLDGGSLVARSWVLPGTNVLRDDLVPHWALLGAYTLRTDRAPPRTTR